MVEGRDGQNRAGIECVEPGKNHEPVALRLIVAQTAGIELLVLEVVRVGIVGNLIIIPTHLGIEPKLILRAQVVDERGELAEAVLRVVEGLRDGCLETEVAAVAIQTGIVGEPRRVAAKTDLVVGLVIASDRCYEFSIVVPFKPGPRGDIYSPAAARPS